jgi:prepilin-type N-terminal cleavage/methylation domain-containing protein
MRRTATRRAFSLIELVIVVVIIGIIAAIAIPRMSRGAAGASDSALIADLSRMRSAIDLYQTEHGGNFPDLVNDQGLQLTEFTDDTGKTSASKTGNYIYGPYIRVIPPLPVGADKGKTAIILNYAATNGWDYDLSTGILKANCPAGEHDSANKDYNTY